MADSREHWSENLHAAAIDCVHRIERNHVVLEYSPRQPGDNALEQLRLRLLAAVDAGRSTSKPLIDSGLSSAARSAIEGLLEIEDARIATGAFKPNAQAQARIDNARALLAQETA